MFKNSLKTVVLLAALGGLIVGIASLLGGGSSSAVMFGLVMALVMVGGSYWFSDKLALKSARAQVITEADHPEFYGMVRNLSQRAGMPMPRVAVSPSEQPNAFATGRGPNNAVVCATTGLLQSLTPAEVEGVMAHELMHVRNRDILIGSVAAAVATAISAIAQMAMFATMFSGGSRNDENRPNPFAILLVSMLAPLAASLIQMAISRTVNSKQIVQQQNFLATVNHLLVHWRKLNRLLRACLCKLHPRKLRPISITRLLRCTTNHAPV